MEEDSITTKFLDLAELLTALFFAFLTPLLLLSFQAIIRTEDFLKLFKRKTKILRKNFSSNLLEGSSRILGRL